jgi:hypothetical protein
MPTTTAVCVAHLALLTFHHVRVAADEGAWQGNTACWSAGYTFESCCAVDPSSQLAQAPGRADCWSGEWTFDSCLCLEPQDCEGVWSECTSGCTKQFSVVVAAENGGVECVAADGGVAACLDGEGDCQSTGRSCNATSVTGLDHGHGGECDGRDTMPHGEECEVTCDDGYIFSGVQPRCFDGALLFTGACNWGGAPHCWNGTGTGTMFTFERCCSVRNGTAVAPGDAICWDADDSRSFDSCRCMEPSEDAASLSSPETSQVALHVQGAILAVVCGAAIVVCTKRRSRVMVVNEQGELVGELQAKVSSLEKEMLEQMVAQCVDKAEASMAKHQQAELEELQA